MVHSRVRDKFVRGREIGRVQNIERDIKSLRGSARVIERER